MVDDDVRPWLQESMRRADPAAGALIVDVMEFPPDLFSQAATSGARARVMRTYVQERMVSACGESGVSPDEIEIVGFSGAIVRAAPARLAALVARGTEFDLAKDLRVHANVVAAHVPDG